jgi:hypothetical protein
MQREEFRRIVADAVNASLKDKSSTVAAPPQAQLDPLIDAIADGIFAGLVATLDEQAPDYFAPSAASAATVAAAPSTTVEWPLPPAPATEPRVEATQTSPAASSAKKGADLLDSVPPASSNAEVLLWRGRPYMTIGRIYELTTQRLRIIHGVVSNQIEEIELVRVRDTKVTQNVGERMFDIGDITVISGDVTTPEKVLYNVKDPVTVRELIRKAVYEERERRRMLYREDIRDDNFDVHPDADFT